MSDSTSVNKFLDGKRISKWQFDDLINVTEVIGSNDSILKWFIYLQEIEIVGWRPKETTTKIAKILFDGSKQSPILFYALFCPSYKKGEDVSGFRTDGVGETTKIGIKNLNDIYQETKKLGFSCQKPLAIFFDLALEQPEKVINKKDLRDLEINIKNFKKELPSNIDFVRLSDLDEDIKRKVGLRGTVVNSLPISQDIFDRVLERGSKFYKLFGWNKKQIVDRTKTICCSEYLVGNFLRGKYPHGIMVYTPTMLERAQIYHPLPIIFPKKGP